MAIEFLRAQVLSRGGVNIRGVPAHMAYRSCSKIYDERQDRTFDYTGKNSVLDSFLINAGDNSLEQLANKMEQAEKRKDAQLAREFILALPHELSLEVNREICERLVDLMVKKYNVAAHVAIHKPDESRKDETHRKSESLKNVHAHITVTTRSIDKNGNIFGTKLREMNDRGYLEGLKTQTREIVNTILKREGFNPMEMRDPSQKPTVHLGPELTRMERRGNPSAKGDNNRLIEKKNQINSKLQAFAAEETVLTSGRIVIDGVNYRNFPYPKGKELKPYELAFKNYHELCREIGQGTLRVKERYDDKMIRSFSYKGQDITVAELALINSSFSNGELAKFEQVLGEKPKFCRPKFKITNEEERQRKTWIGKQRISPTRKPNIQQVNTNAQVAEAFWYGQQAAFAMEQSSNLE